jgi:hypothetical protein
MAAASERRIAIETDGLDEMMGSWWRPPPDPLEDPFEVKAADWGTASD